MACDTDMEVIGGFKVCVFVFLSYKQSLSTVLSDGSISRMGIDANLNRIATAAAPLRMQVTERLREAIAEGELKPGDRLIERELCETLGVSRTSLRESLRELENDGLVTNLPNRGLIVSIITAKGAREIYEIREMFESFIAGRFAELASSSQRALLEQRVNELAKAYRSGKGIATTKAQYYDVLFSGADHALAVQMLRTIQVRAGQLRNMTLSDPDRASKSIGEIRELLAAILKGDAKGASLAARTHVRNAGALALRLLEREIESNARNAA
jgi:GntR family transcriptional regulator, trigonelline degradation regulator